MDQVVGKDLNIVISRQAADKLISKELTTFVTVSASDLIWLESLSETENKEIVAVDNVENAVIQVGVNIDYKKGEIHINPINKSLLDVSVFENNYIVVSKDWFGHIMNCLANQKFIPLIDQQAEMEREMQKTIDVAWCKGMDILTKYINDSNILSTRKLKCNFANLFV